MRFKASSAAWLGAILGRPRNGNALRTPRPLRRSIRGRPFREGLANVMTDSGPPPDTLRPLCGRRASPNRVNKWLSNRCDCGGRSAPTREPRYAGGASCAMRSLAPADDGASRRVGMLRQRDNLAARVHMAIDEGGAAFGAAAAPIRCRHPDRPERAAALKAGRHGFRQTIRFGRLDERLVAPARKRLLPVERASRNPHAVCRRRIIQSVWQQDATGRAERDDSRRQ